MAEKMVFLPFQWVTGKGVVNMSDAGDQQRWLGVPIVDNSFSPISLAYAFASIQAPSDLSDESDKKPAPIH
jgi:hypothetical protein